MIFQNSIHALAAQQDSRKRLRDYFVIYTILFTGIALIVYGTFLKSGKSMIWQADGITQHYNALVYFGRWGREIIRNLLVNHELSVPLWDFNLGYGADIPATLHYYVIGDPLALLSIAVPSRYTEYLYGALIIFRLYLAGIAFSCYCFCMKKARIATMAGTFSYIFCGFALFSGVRHPYFLNPMIYLPFLLIGAERIFHKKKPTLFIWMVFISAISNFYFFYMLVFAVVLYAVIRFFTLQHTDFIKDMWSDIFRFLICGIVGTAMSAVILLPVILLFLGTYRTGVRPEYSFLYSLDYYKKCLSYLLTVQTTGHWAFLGYTAPAVLGVIVLFSKKRHLTSLKAAFLVLTVMYCLPFAGSAMNGFSYVSNRWCWIYAALISFIMVSVWPDLIAMQKRQKIFVLAGVFLYLLTLWNNEYTTKKVLISALILLATAILLVFHPSGGGSRVLRMISLCLAAVTVFHVCSNAYYLFDTKEKGYVSQFIDSGKALKTITGSEASAVRQIASGDTAFGRNEQESYPIKNTDGIVGVPGVSFYWSLANGKTSQYLFEMSMNNIHSFLFRGLNHRTFLDALASVKYYVGSENTVPFGFEKVDTGQKGIHLSKGNAIYQNRYALPLGYTYSSRITREYYDKLSAARKQEALLQGILLEDSAVDTIPDSIPEIQPVFSSQSPDYVLKCGDGVIRQEDGSFLVNKKRACLELNFEGMENCELFLLASGVDITPMQKIRDDGSIVIKAESENYQDKFVYITSEGSWTSGQSDFLVNLGYQKAPRTSIKIKFSKKGVYRFDNLQVICQPMDNYMKQVAALREDVMEQEEIGTNYVKGTIQLNQDKLLCLTIPYDQGWTAYVDGVKTELLQANTMFTALPLTAGQHTIELHYQTRGLKAGAAITAIGFILFLVIVVSGKRKTVRS